MLRHLFLIALQFTCQADQWRDSWANWGHLCISHRPGKNSPAKPAEWPANVHQHVSTTHMGSIPWGFWQGILPLCYLFQVSSAFLGTGQSPEKPGNNLEPSYTRETWALGMSCPRYVMYDFSWLLAPFFQDEKGAGPGSGSILLCCSLRGWE